MSDSRRGSPACPDLADLWLASEGALSDLARRAVQAHVRGCGACRRRLAAADTLLARLHEASSASGLAIAIVQQRTAYARFRAALVRERQRARVVQA